MTNYQLDQYMLSYMRDNYMCICGAPAIQQAHKIINSRVNKKIYSERFINHHSNIRSVCGLRCNQKVAIADCKIELIKKQIEIIKEAILND